MAMSVSFFFGSVSCSCDDPDGPIVVDTPVIKKPTLEGTRWTCISDSHLVVLTFEGGDTARKVNTRNGEVALYKYTYDHPYLEFNPFEEYFIRLTGEVCDDTLKVMNPFITVGRNIIYVFYKEHGNE